MVDVIVPSIEEGPPVTRARISATLLLETLKSAVSPVPRIKNPAASSGVFWKAD